MYAHADLLRVCVCVCEVCAVRGLSPGQKVATTPSLAALQCTVTSRTLSKEHPCSGGHVFDNCSPFCTGEQQWVGTPANKSISSGARLCILCTRCAKLTDPTQAGDRQASAGSGAGSYKLVLALTSGGRGGGVGVEIEFLLGDPVLVRDRDSAGREGLTSAARPMCGRESGYDAR